MRGAVHGPRRVEGWAYSPTECVTRCTYTQFCISPCLRFPIHVCHLMFSSVFLRQTGSCAVSENRSKDDASFEPEREVFSNEHFSSASCQTATLRKEREKRISARVPRASEHDSVLGVAFTLIQIYLQTSGRPLPRVEDACLHVLACLLRHRA